MFKTRLISGVIVLAIAVAAILAGGYVLFFFTAAISLIGLFEYYRALTMEKSLTAIAGYCGWAVLYLLLFFGVHGAAMMGMAAGTIFIMSVYVFTFPRFKAQDAFAAIAGLAYVALLMSFLYQVRILEDGLWIIPLVFISAWGNDTCAYCVGMLIGKHKMFPVLSPKKSVEGFIGGIAGAAVLGLIYGLVFGKNIPSLAMPAAGCTLICGVGALIAVVGDLAASAIKRDTQIKDYGKLIPGHGGILDRFDSILFTAPAVFILAVLLGA